MIYNNIIEKYNKGEKQLALLIDPDKCNNEALIQFEKVLQKVTPDLLMVGGSLVSSDIGQTVTELKIRFNLPVILYPGNNMQFTTKADALLFLSLVSGRNPEFLIGQQVVAAPLIKKAGMETIATGYMIIDGGRPTSAEYMSNTRPLPANKPDIAVATALAAEMLGMKMIYMDAGSGADNPIPEQIISAVRSNISIPLMVGGGINTEEKVRKACLAGADILIIGNAFEKDVSLLEAFHKLIKAL